MRRRRAAGLSSVLCVPLSPFSLSLLSLPSAAARLSSGDISLNNKGTHNKRVCVRGQFYLFICLPSSFSRARFSFETDNEILRRKRSPASDTACAYFCPSFKEFRIHIHVERRGVGAMESKFAALRKIGRNFTVLWRRRRGETPLNEPRGHFPFAGPE